MDARPSRSRRRLRVAVPLSLAAHAALLAVLLAARSDPPAEPAAPEPVAVTLVQPPPPPPPPAEAPRPEPAPPAPAAAAPRPPPRLHRPVPPPPRVAPLPARPSEVAAPETGPVATPIASLGEAQLAGAATAGSGSGAGGAGSGSGAPPCDMVRRLQDALRRDPQVRAAAARAHRAAGPGRAVLVWDGDWVRDPGQDGKGLAGVRQAIALEVAFAPEACRADPVRGLVLISMADGPGAPRLVLGAGRWRWSDLLGARIRR